MWTERPRPFTDGLLVVIASGLVLGAIISIGRASDPSAAKPMQCQEVVVDVHQGEEVLAQCPPGHWLDIVDNNVVCRCQPPTASPPVHPLPPAESPGSDDKHGIDI